MKKSILSLVAALTCLTASAQVILQEDFETGNTGSKPQPVAVGEGWETIDGYTGTNVSYTWHNYYSDPDGQTGPTISGASCAACDGPISTTPTDGSGPREEILLSPELTLDDTYQLQFTWRVSPMNAQDNSRYDFQVRVVSDGNLESAETIFSIQNEQMLRESGITVFPITTWDPHTSKVDLSDWKGEKIRLAFVYKMLAASSNVLWLDDITVTQFTPATGPVASVSLDRYDFKEVYIGERRYSDVITLTNTGKDGLQITDVELPQGIALTIDPATVNLRTYESIDFQLAYTASMTSRASGDVVLHTTGGDVTIAFTAQKQLVPEGYLLETFEKYFPPAGWRSSGWAWTTTALEGDHSVYSGGDFSATYLRSPRLDLSNGGELTFTYYNYYYGESAPEYDIELQVSYDNGDTWKTKWVSDYQNGLNQVLTATVDLGLGSDESYVRWYYPAVESDDEGAYEHSSFTLDRVLLPSVYGMDGVPGNCTLVSPANNATEVYPKDIVLKWGPAQFATGYKVYVGTNTEANDLIEGANVGDALTYTIPVADFETTYRWKVVAYNDKGESTTASTWRFTTQKDASVMDFPYEENFDECTSADPIPTGWLSTSTGQYAFAKWSPNASYPYGDKGACMASGWLNDGESTSLTSPEFRLPADGKSMSISFVWGNAHPSDLLIDETGLLKKNNVEGGNGRDEVVFEIYCDGEWTQASYLSEGYNDDGETKYWRNETIELDQYAGKTVQFRWTTNCFKTYAGYGALDNVVIDGTVLDGVAFNHESWDAGKVNYGRAVNSGDLFTIRNTGKSVLRVKSATFATEYFATSIAAGDELALGDGKHFDITFQAKDAEDTVTDELTIEFENGYKAMLPVRGIGLPKDVLYYAFEPNELDYLWKEDFTMIDVDKKVNHELGYYLTTVENDGGRYAFTQVTNNNTQMLAAVSGNHTIAAAAPADGSAADDWLISKQLIPAEGAMLDFYARNLGTTNTVFVGDNDLHHVEVLVSEAGNTKTADFKTVMSDTEMAYLAENEWHHFEVDLSDYAGKRVYVAVRHTTISANAMAFFDDFTFTGVTDAQTDGLEAVQAGLGEQAQVEVYGLNGMLIATGRGAATLQSLDRGIYIVKVNEQGRQQTLRVVR